MAALRPDGADTASTQARSASVELLLRHERRVVMAALGIVAALAWAYTLSGATGMAPMAEEGMAMAGMAMRHLPWSSTTALLMFAMWWVMMIAMMLPSAAPVALLFAAINRRRNGPPDVFVPTGVFVAGYLAMWAGFSLIATLAQWGLDVVGLLSQSMAVGSARVGGAFLLAAGVYQLSPVKKACLRHCQNPVMFISRHWRPGAGGAFRMGVVHGAYCLGCCWFLMALLFFGGIMNFFWIAGLALYIAAEKMIRHGQWVTYLTGGVLAACGVLVVIRTF